MTGSSLVPTVSCISAMAIWAPFIFPAVVSAATAA